MKKLLVIILSILLLGSCRFDSRETRWKNYGVLNNVSLDDDGEYHFSTDHIVKNDVRSSSVLIERTVESNTAYLYLEEKRCPTGKFCENMSNEWDPDVSPRYKLVIPATYQIKLITD